MRGSNSQKTSKRFGGTIKPSELYGHTKEQARDIEEKVFRTKRWAQHILKCVFKGDLLSAVAKNDHSIALINARREDIKSSEFIQTWFDALVVKFKLRGEDIHFPKLLPALQLLNASYAEDNQEVINFTDCVKHMIVEQNTSTLTQNSAYIMNIC